MGSLAWIMLSWTRRAFCDSRLFLPAFLEFVDLLAQVLEFPLERLFSVGIHVQQLLHLEQREPLQDHGGFQGGHGNLEIVQLFLGLGQTCRGARDPGFPGLEVLL